MINRPLQALNEIKITILNPLQLKNRLFITGIVVVSMCFFACNKPAERMGPHSFGGINALNATDKSVVDSLIINSYALLDGFSPALTTAPWASGSDNWIFGSVAGGEAHKGSNPNDQLEAGEIATFTTTTANSYFDAKWSANMDGLHYANQAIHQLSVLKDGTVSAAYAAELTSEARFLRGFFEFEMAKLWRNAPYVTSGAVYNNGYNGVPNNGPIWTQIEADFDYARTHLPSTQALVGRPNKFAAEAFLAKTLLFDHQYLLAKPLLADLIAHGETSKGVKYALVPYADNFNPSKQNGPEGVFVIQAVVHDGSGGYDGNAGDVLNFPTGGPAQCCGFFSPSFSFVNAFKTDPTTGLPLLDNYNKGDVKNDQGITASAPFTPTTGTLDARLDWTVGRRGIPCLDWGNAPGDTWAHDQIDAGPYFNLKTLYYQAAKATTSEDYAGWGANMSTSNCYNAIRYADVLLWAAEVEVEAGSLQKAEDYVNMVRSRAANHTGWVHKYIDPANPMGGFTNTPAANYKVGLYGAAGNNAASSFVANGQSYARKAVYFERTLELGLEGHRFFDLQRWDGIYGGPAGSGYMASILNAYIAHENGVKNFGPIYFSAHFTANRNELFPIPQNEITASAGKLKQNPGY